MSETEIRYLLTVIERELRALPVSPARGVDAPYFEMRVGIEADGNGIVCSPEDCYTRVVSLNSVGRVDYRTHNGNRRLT